MLSLIRKN